MISSQATEHVLNLVGGTNFSRATTITDEATINMMVTSADEIKALIDYPGYQKKISFPKGSPREIYTSTRLNEMVVVVGNSVYLVNSTLGFRLVGNLSSYTGAVYVSENQNNEIGIVDNLALYIYNYSANTFTRYNVADVIPNFITFLDTYFFLTDATNGHFQISNSGQGSVYNPAMIGQLQTEADQLQAMVALDRTLWALGKKVSELWNDNPTGYNNLGNLSGISFPIQRNNSLSIGYGILSVQSLAVGFGRMIWLAFNAKSGPTLVYTTGGKPKELSSDGLDYIIKKLGAPQDCTAVLFQQNGHIIYQANFYTDNLSIAYDFSENVWYIVTDEKQNHHIAKRMTFFNDQFYFINFDSDAPGLYELNDDFTTYDGKIIPRIRVCAPIRQLAERSIIDWVKLDMEQGYNSDPGRIDMSVSKDGGQRFGNNVSRNMAAQGDRRRFLKWEMLGLANDFRTKFQFLTSGRVVVLGAKMGVRQ